MSGAGKKAVAVNVLGNGKTECSCCSRCNGNDFSSSHRFGLTAPTPWKKASAWHTIMFLWQRSLIHFVAHNWDIIKAEMPRHNFLDDQLVTETLPWANDMSVIADAEMPRLNGHQASWVTAVSKGLRHRAYLIQTKRNSTVVGVLPLNFVSGPLFGKFLVSLPYLNTGGVWAQDYEVGQALIDEACRLADKLNVKHLELRHELPVQHGQLNMERTDKSHMRMALPATADELMASLKSKVRSQTKKSQRGNLTVDFGQKELLSEFYQVFSVNMRDLGTPVFSRNLFSSILKEFDGNAELCVVRSEGNPAAAGLLVHANGVTEVPSASCLRSYNRLNANMYMYWNLFERAIERGSHTFDFGRSSEGSGTYKFKAQWGAKPQPAVWQYYVRKGNPEDMRPDSEGKQKLIRIWQKLPVWFANLVGPSIVRGIP